MFNWLSKILLRKSSNVKTYGVCKLISSSVYNSAVLAVGSVAVDVGIDKPIILYNNAMMLSVLVVYRFIKLS